MKRGVLQQPSTHDNTIFTFSTTRLGVTSGEIMFVDLDKVATETGHTRSTIEWKKGSLDSMIGIVNVQIHLTLERHVSEGGKDTAVFKDRHSRF